MRPAGEVEVAAHRVLTGEPVLPEAIYFADERRADPVTAPANPRPNVAAAPSTAMLARYASCDKAT